LEGKIAVITGGSSGMALATAKLFVQQGAYVFVTGRDQNRLDRAVREIGGNVTGVQGDGASLADLDRLYDTVRIQKGRIDVLYVSAGRGEFAKFGEVTERHFDDIMNLNVRGTLFTVQKALPLFVEGGSIIMTGSMSSIKGVPNLGVYSASKAAIRSFARTWVMDLRERNIRVNVLSPGPIDTPMYASPSGEAAKDYFRAQIPRKTLGRPEEIATAALFLACADSSFVNGIELFVDGGTVQI
jgi:NAD(P)-dependent dehydrogenase (short-subunit alcohol dehydrogenase family)